MSQTDIVQELDNAFNHVAVCHCGNGYLDGSCDNHDFRWNPCDDSMMLANARMEIIRLRCKLGLPAIPSLVEPGPITQLRKRLDAVEKELQQTNTDPHRLRSISVSKYRIGMAEENKKLRLSNERMREALGKIDDAGRKDGESMADTACWNPEDAHKEGWACGAHFAGRIARIALSPCRGIEIEPGVFSGCDAYLTGATDCPQCGKAALTAESGTEGKG